MNSVLVLGVVNHTFFDNSSLESDTTLSENTARHSGRCVCDCGVFVTILCVCVCVSACVRACVTECVTECVCIHMIVVCVSLCECMYVCMYTHPGVS